MIIIFFSERAELQAQIQECNQAPEVTITESHRIHSKVKEHKKIVKNVSGCVNPGTLLAIMGGSGAGKKNIFIINLFLKKFNSFFYIILFYFVIIVIILLLYFIIDFYLFIILLFFNIILLYYFLKIIFKIIFYLNYI